MNAQVTEAHVATAAAIFRLAEKAAHNGDPFRAPFAQLIADSEAAAVKAATTRADCLQNEVDRWTKWNMEQPWLAEIRGHSQQVASLTGERDRLRAEVERLKKEMLRVWSWFPAVPGKTVTEYTEEGILGLRYRAEKAEDEVKRLKELHQLDEAMIVQRTEALNYETEATKAFCDDRNAQRARAERAELEVAKLRSFYDQIVAECGHDSIVREYRQRGELLRDEANRRKEAEAGEASLRAELAEVRQAHAKERQVSADHVSLYKEKAALANKYLDALAAEKGKVRILRSACAHVSYIPRVQSALDSTEETK